MQRFIVTNRDGTPIAELSPKEVIALERREAVNGEHSLTVTTTMVLDKGQRIIYQDARGVWREYCVEGIDENHAARRTILGTYYCVWSLQSDLLGVPVSVMPGVQNPVSAASALTSLLTATARWNRGTVNQATTGGASMYDTDAWSAMSTLVEVWGGEVDTTISVNQSQVSARYVDLYAHLGESTPKRRFDFGADIASVRRTIPDEPLYCRISPRGAGEQTEGGGYGRKIRITSVNDGKDYLENHAMVEAAKLPDGSGGWEYPTVIVENTECTTPQQLLDWARTVLEESTTPRVTYECDVLQAAEEGIDFQGVSLGDEVQVVDRYFGDGIRITARVVEMVTDEVGDAPVQVTLGSMGEDLSTRFAAIDTRITTVLNTVFNMNGGTYVTTDYLSRLLERLNEEANATGGYTYITEGQGIRTYDTAVSDPLIGAEASAVVEVKGGTIRIANTKTAQGEWEWKTVFTAGHIAGEVVTAAQITTGYIGSAGGTYIDLDNETVNLGDENAAHVALTSSALEIFSTSNQSVGLFSSNGGTPVFRLGPSSGAATLYSDGSSVFIGGIDSSSSLIELSRRGIIGGLSVSAPIDTASLYNLVFGNGATAARSNLYAVSNAMSVGLNTYASGIAASATGEETKAYGRSSHAEGYATTAGIETLSSSSTGQAAHAEGYSTTASGQAAHAEGYRTAASGQYAHAEGFSTEASGNYSHAEGNGAIASAIAAHAEGYGQAQAEAAHAEGGSVASGVRSHAEGWSCKASGIAAHAEGNSSTASGNYSHAAGYGSSASGSSQTVVGKWNATSTSHLFIVGKGTAESSRSNAFYVASNGNIWCAGTLTQASDRRLKKHLAWLGDDAAEFVRKLKPALYERDGLRRLGFYAQDVEEADGWDTATVVDAGDDGDLHNVLSLDYTALIAPLVAYCQQLEKRIEELENELNQA